MKISSKEEFEKLNVFGTGTANTAYAKYFIGDSFLNPLTKAEDGLFLANCYLTSRIRIFDTQNTKSE